jgi:hypothetical protein
MKSNIWDTRKNIHTKPSVSTRTDTVITYVMNKYSIGIGQAIEKIMIENIYEESLEELSKVYNDIK